MDVVRGHGPKSRWGEIEKTFQIACAVIVTAAGAAFAISNDRFKNLRAPSLTATYSLEVLKVLLLITIAGLVFRWIFAVSGEMRLLREYFPNQIRPQPGQVYVWTVIFSVLLGTLFALTGNIIAFSAVFAVYSVGDMWGQKIRDAQLKPGFHEARDEVIDDDLRARRAVIESYYLTRPQIERAATIMFFSFVALSLALAGNGASTDIRNRVHVASYAIVIINVLVSEIVIGRWRRQRDLQLHDRYSF